MRQTLRLLALVVAGLFVAGVFAAAATGDDARALSSPRPTPRVARGLEDDPVASTRVLLASLPRPVPAATPALAKPAPARRAGPEAASRSSAAPRSASSEKPLVWPAQGPMTGWFGEERSSHDHKGIDIDGNTGDAIWSAARGRVVHAGPAPAGYSGYGNVVVIDHGTGQTIYAHLSRIDVAVGDQVEALSAIGAMGMSGNVTGSHLHFELRVNGVPVDPVPYLPAR